MRGNTPFSEVKNMYEKQQLENMNDTLFGGQPKPDLCLDTGEANVSSDVAINHAINCAAKYTVFDPTPDQMSCLKMYQNNEHHLEGWLYNHIILMLLALRFYGRFLSEDKYRTIERAIYWSDLGKLETKDFCYKMKKGEIKVDDNGDPIYTRTWKDGSPQSGAKGHDKKSAEMHFEAHPEDRVVNFLVAEHMKAHNMAEQFEKLAGTTGLAHFNTIEPDADGLYPEWDQIAWPHGSMLSKKQYTWAKLASNSLLIIKQKCDSAGRISNLSFA